MLFSGLNWRLSKYLSAFSVMLFLFCANAAAEKLVLFNIPKLQANKGLQLFGLQSKSTIVFSHSLAEVIETNPVKGYYSREQALYLLLRNTGLVARTQAQNTIVIKPEPPSNNQQPLNDSAKLLENKVQIRDGLTIEKISVFGQPYSARSVTDLAVPVDIITSEQIKASGQTELGRMLQMLAPSFNYPSSAISDGTDVLKPATLRGLGPDQTLVLINGKRRHQASLVHINTSVGRGTAGVDFNAIPINAIDKIEILRDGAAARFGSDAIAGVINIVLKSKHSENQLALDYGQFSQGDGDKYNLYSHINMPMLEDGFFNVAFNYKSQESTNRSGLHANCQFEDCIKLDNGYWLSKTLQEKQAKRDVFQIGSPEYNQLITSYNASLPIGNNELYSFAIYSKRKNESAAFFRFYNDDQSNPKLSDGQRLSTTGYLPIIQSDIVDLSYTLGLKHRLSTSTLIDFSYGYGKNTIDYSVKNSFNPSFSLFQDKVLSVPTQSIREQSPPLVKAYGLSLSLQTLNLDVTHMASWGKINAGLELRQDQYLILPGEQYSYYDFVVQGQAKERAFSGVQGFPGISPSQGVNKQRDVLSVYADLSSDLTDHIYLNSAIRYDSHSDFGKTSNVKMALLWQLTDFWNIRSSISTGFRAPSMPQLYFNNISTQFIVNNDNQLIAEQVGTFRNDSYLAKSIGIKPLTEEKSLNFSLGTTLSLQNGLTFTLDIYRIDIDDRIVISNKLCADDSVSLALALANENIKKAQFFLNGANTKTFGIDLITQWQHQIGTSNLSFTLAANYTDTEVTNLISPVSQALSPLTIDQIFSQQDISIIEEWQPESRVSFSSRYIQGAWVFDVALNHFGQYTITDGDQQTFSPELLTDIKLTYHLDEQLALYMGSNNLFNVHPDRNRIGNSHGGTIVDEQGEVIVSSPGVFKYSRRSAPFGFNGRYAYFGVSYIF